MNKYDELKISLQANHLAGYWCGRFHRFQFTGNIVDAQPASRPASAPDMPTGKDMKKLSSHKTLHIAYPFFLFFFSLLFFRISDASDKVKLPPFPEIPSAPNVISNGSVYFVNKDRGKDSFTLEDAKNHSKPWATIQRGVSALREGDVLIVSESSTPYKERVIVDIAGSERNWITIKGANGERPILDGFVLEKNSQFIKLDNFHLVPKKIGIYLKRGVKNFFIEDTEIDGRRMASHGLQFGADVIDEYGVKRGYVKNVTVHHTVGYGVYIENGAQDIVFDGVISRNSLKGDGFAGAANPSEYKSPNKNLFFVDSQAYENAGDGFDIGSDVTQVFERCISHSNGGRQGHGFKVWGGVNTGGDIWLINNLVYNNAYPALSIKNISDANIYILHNTFAGNETAGGGVEINTVNHNSGSGGFYMGAPRIFLYNNLIFSRAKNRIPVFAFYNEDTKVEGSDCNYIVRERSDGRNVFCQIRNDNMDVVGELSVDDMNRDKKGKSKTYCGYSKNDAEAHSLIHVQKATDETGFRAITRNNYDIREGSPAINRGCIIGVAKDIHRRPRELNAPDIGAFEYVPVKSQ